MSDTPQPPYPQPDQGPAYPPQAAPPPPPGYVPQPYPPQPYPPQAAPPPAPPTLPPGYVDPHAAYGGQQPPRKRRSGAVVGVIVALIAGCGLFLCAALLIGSLSGGGDKAKLGVAEDHFKAASSAVASATAVVDTVNAEDASSEDVSKAIADARESIRTGRDEIAVSRASIEQMKDSEGKTAYLGSLDAAAEALDGLEEYLAYIDSASGMVHVAQDARKKADAATDDLNAAIGAGNASKYKKMASEAKSARSGFTKAAELFRKAHDVDPSAGLDKAAKLAENRRKQAEVVIDMASAGKAGSSSRYNSGIKKLSKLDKEGDKIDPPAIYSDSNWVETRLGELQKRIQDAATRADELRAKALESLGS